MTKIRSQIMKEILKTVRKNEKCGKKEISEAVELDRDILEEYLSTMTDEGFLDEHHSKASYNLTERGESMLKSFDKLDDITSISIIF